MRDLVIGIDSSTQSTKAIAVGRDGAVVAEGRAPHGFDAPRPGWAEQDPEDWWRATCAALRAVAGAVDPGRVAAVAAANQRETVALVDGAGRPLRPAILWLDERGREMLAETAAALGAERLHRVSGKPVDLNPALYKLAWLARHEPTALAAARVLDAHGFLTLRLTGEATTSWTSADPSGLFDLVAKRWDPAILGHLGLSAERLARPVAPGAAVGALHAAAAAATGLRAGTPVIAAGGDGQCAGLGADAARPGRAYLNLGTAVVTGAWSAEPRIGRGWRTLASPTGEGYFLEGSLRAGTFLLDWFLDGFAGGRGDAAARARLEAQAAAIPPGCEGLAVCPYLSGCMDPHWNPAARASFAGIGPHHGPAHLYRAILEGLTLEAARCLDGMRAAGVAASRIVAVGGGARSGLWLGMVADASGLPVEAGESPEASALGAAMTAAVGAGWFDGFDAAAAAMARPGAVRAPDPAARAAWDAASARQAAAYVPAVGAV